MADRSNMTKAQRRRRLHKEVRSSIVLLEVISRFAVRIIDISQVPTLLEAVASEVVGELGYEDCVIYERSDDGEHIIQVAAHGQKASFKGYVEGPLTIPVGEGVTGRVAQTGQPMLVEDTRELDEHIVDVGSGRSELAVPIEVDGVVYGVLDSESPTVGRFDEWDLKVFTTIAAMTAHRIKSIGLTHANRFMVDTMRAHLEKERDERQVETDFRGERDRARAGLASELSAEIQRLRQLVLEGGGKGLSKQAKRAATASLVDVIESLAAVVGFATELDVGKRKPRERRSIFEMFGELEIPVLSGFSRLGREFEVVSMGADDVALVDVEIMRRTLVVASLIFSALPFGANVRVEVSSVANGDILVRFGNTVPLEGDASSIIGAGSIDGLIWLLRQLVDMNSGQIGGVLNHETASLLWLSIPRRREAGRPSLDDDDGARTKDVEIDPKLIET